MTEWQTPISTHPRDGDPFFVWGPEAGFNCVYFEDKQGRHGITTWGGTYITGSEWCFGQMEGDLWLHRDLYTHWMRPKEPSHD